MSDSDADDPELAALDALDAKKERYGGAMSEAQYLARKKAILKEY